MSQGVNADDLPVEVDDFLLALRVERGRSANTLKAYATDLRAYVAWLDDRGLTIGEVDEDAITDYVTAILSQKPDEFAVLGARVGTPSDDTAELRIVLPPLEETQE